MTTEGRMTEADLARDFEERKGDLSQWETKPRRIRVRRGGPSTVFSIRFAPEELKLIQLAAMSQGMTVSEFVRRASLGAAEQRFPRMLSEGKGRTAGNSQLMNPKNSAYEELISFIYQLRDRILGLDVNNRLGQHLGDIGEERATLDIILSRYDQAARQWNENSNAWLRATRNQPGVSQSITDEQSSLHSEAVVIQRGLRLEIRSFYDFAKILLDKMARFVEFYFGSARGLSLDSHHKMVDHLERFCADKDLSMPEGFLDAAKDLKARISDYRDKRVTHPKGAKLTATLLTKEGQVSLVHGLSMPMSDGSARQSEPPPALAGAVDAYIRMFIEMLHSNEAKARLSPQPN